jgi:hypothetical protein
MSLNRFIFSADSGLLFGTEHGECFPAAGLAERIWSSAEHSNRFNVTIICGLLNHQSVRLRIRRETNDTTGMYSEGYPEVSFQDISMIRQGGSYKNDARLPQVVEFPIQTPIPIPRTGNYRRPIREIEFYPGFQI